MLAIAQLASNRGICPGEENGDRLRRSLLVTTVSPWSYSTFFPDLHASFMPTPTFRHLKCHGCSQTASSDR